MRCFFKSCSKSIVTLAGRSSLCLPLISFGFTSRRILYCRFPAHDGLLVCALEEVFPNMRIPTAVHNKDVRQTLVCRPKQQVTLVFNQILPNANVNASPLPPPTNLMCGNFWFLVLVGCATSEVNQDDYRVLAFRSLALRALVTFIAPSGPRTTRSARAKPVLYQGPIRILRQITAFPRFRQLRKKP